MCIHVKNKRKEAYSSVPFISTAFSPFSGRWVFVDRSARGWVDVESILIDWFIAKSFVF